MGYRHCSVRNCYRNSKNKEARFFRIPAVVKHRGIETTHLTSKRRFEWLKRLRLLGQKVTEAFRVCDAHFIKGIIMILYLFIYKLIVYLDVCRYYV